MKTLRRLNGSARSAGGIAPQDRKGGEQRREHDHVAEDEDPEPISDDDALRGRPAAAAPAREFGWNPGWSSIDYFDCHAGCFTSSGPFHSRNFGGRDFVLALDAPASYQDDDHGGEEAEDRQPPDVPDQRKTHDHGKESGNETGWAVARHFDSFVCRL